MSSSTANSPEITLRPVRAEDVPGVIALVDTVYREYGDRICLDDADRDLLTIHEHYHQQGGDCVVLSVGARVVGLHAVVPLEGKAGICTFRRLYLDKSLRGFGWGERLMQWAVDRAIEMGFRRVEFWSDTRFTRAHRFFGRLGFRQTGEVREMRDAFEPYHEYFFCRDL